jgi:hypothetical protein
MVRKWWATCAVGLAVALLATTGCGGSKPQSLPAGTVADTGFRPTGNGFSFQNYGDILSNGSAPINLTAADVHEMFGDAVCADAQSHRCDLNPEAQAWLADTNQAMAGGHCYGFSVLAELMWLGTVKASTYGANGTASLQVNANQALQRQLAYDWTLQTLASVQSERITGTPNQILDKLKQVLKPHPSQTYTLTFWKRDGSGGHAVTPYEVENKGGGHVDVLIYDNNWPNRTRAIAFDTTADTWSYNAAVNPNQPDSLYEGDAQTETLSLAPTSPGLGRQDCPFCAKEPNTTGAKVGNNLAEITLLGSDTHHANLVISDDAGHQLGYVNGKLVNQIPGAQVDRVTSNQDWTENITPDFFVPADVTYTLKMDGQALTAPDTETLAVIGPSYDLSVNDIPVSPGSSDTLVVKPDASHLSYTSSNPQVPLIKLGVSDSKADYAFELAGISDQPGSTLNVGLPSEGGTLSLARVGTAPISTVHLKMTRETEQGVQVFNHAAVPLASGDLVQLQFGNWTGDGQTIPLTTTHNGQPSTQSLTNEGA